LPLDPSSWQPDSSLSWNNMSDCNLAESVIANDRSRLCCMGVVVKLHNTGNPEA
jgi:hypothetical protein